MANRKEKGREGELLAGAFLESRGLRIACRNFRCPIGEIDLVAWDRQTIVFVEVKSRRSIDYGFPQESVAKGKQRRLTRLAQWYIKQHRLEGTAARFDVVAISWQTGKPEIDWLVNAFEACE